MPYKNKEARSEVHKKSYNTAYKIRRNWLNELKAKPCMDCGNSFPPECMDFDHRPNEVKKFHIGQEVTKALKTLKEEIAKCDVVCANCHRIRTTDRRKLRTLCEVAK